MTYASLVWANVRRFPTRNLLSLAAVTSAFTLFALILGIAEGFRAAALAQGSAVQPAVLISAVAIAVIGVFLTMALTASAMAQSIRARETEWAVLAALGFSPRQIAALLVAEAGVICAPGTLLGLAGAKILFKAMLDWLPAMSAVPAPVYTAPLLLGAVAVSLALSLATAALPARRLYRADVATLVRGALPAPEVRLHASRVQAVGDGAPDKAASATLGSSAGPLDLALLRQVAIVTRIALATLQLRWRGALLVVASSGAVVFLLLVPLTIADSLRAALTGSGDPARVVLRSSASALLHLSRIPEDLVPLIGAAPGVARSAAGLPLVQFEVFAWPKDLINRRTGKGGHTSVVGVSPWWTEMTPEFRLLSGRMPRVGHHEVVAGTLAAAKFSSLDRGTVQIGDATWQIVGIFATGGWWDGYLVADAAELKGMALPSAGGAIRIRLSSPEQFDAFARTAMPLLSSSMTLERETDHYAAFWSRVPKHLVYIAFVVAALISAGAALGTTLVTETALDARRREIATLRLLGFDAHALAASVVLEGLVLALSGALLGALAVWLVMNGRIVNGAWGVSQLVFSHRQLLVAIGWGAGIALAGTSVLALRTLNTTALEAIRQLCTAVRNSWRLLLEDHIREAHGAARTGGLAEGG